MDVINILDAQSANMIAAGEVVERPAAAVKELVENAIDAGASTISVEIKNGGNTLIRVSDDGCGISKTDLPKALLRHATSKIKSGADIDGVLTLGFRGEALAAISAVSKLSIISRHKDTSYGNLLTADGDNVTIEEIGCPVGTTVLVEELFYNTPARRKFMKKDATEGAACRAAVEKAAVAHPEIAFRFTADGELKLSTTGDGVLKNAIADAMGASFAKGLIELKGEAEEVAVHGYVSAPDAARGRNTAGNCFINGRYVVSKTVQAAVKEAFKSYLPHDRYPAYVLFLTVPPRFVDVNVHPAKIEVKFASERPVYEAVYYGIRSALQRADAFTGTEEDILVTKGDIKPSYKPPQPTIPQPIIKDNNLKQSAAIFSAAEFTPTLTEAEQEFQAIPKATPVTEEKPDPMLMPLHAPSVSAVLNDQQEIESAPKHRYVGEAFNAYIMAETDEALYIIDKHAAHERILYEQLRQSTAAQSQMLLTPVVVDLTEEEVQLLSDNRAYLLSLGFDVDAFGDKSVALRAVPAAIGGIKDAAAVIEQFAAALNVGGMLPFEERVDRALFTVACKAALKAGRKSGAEDNMWIIDRLFEDGSIKYCPHGRPVAKVFTKREADKWFDR